MTRLPPEPRVGVVTQARTTSTRLPGKVLLQLGGRTVLDHHLDRLLSAGLRVLVATTTNAADDEIVALAHRRDVGCFRGSETDVLARFHGCAQEFELDVVVRVTSDCPLIDGELVARAVQRFIDEDDDSLFLSNSLHRTFPRGLDFEVFSAAALAAADRHSTDSVEREHVTPYMYRGPGRRRLEDVLWHEDKSGYRITLDTAEDLALLRSLVEDYAAATKTTSEIIGVLDAHPELAGLNSSVRQKHLGER